MFLLKLFLKVMDYKYDALSAQGTGFLPNVYVLNGATTPETVEAI